MAPSSSTWVSRSSSSCRDSCCTAPSSQRAWRTPDGHGSGPTWSVAQCGCCPATGWRSPSSLWSSRSSSMSSGRIGGSSTRWARHGCPAGCSTASAPARSLSAEASVDSGAAPRTRCRGAGRRFGHLTACPRGTVGVRPLAVVAAGDPPRGAGSSSTGAMARGVSSVWVPLFGHLELVRCGPRPRGGQRALGGSDRRPRVPRFVEERPGLCWLLAACVYAALGFLRGSPATACTSRASLWRCCSWRLRSSATSARGLPHRVLGNRVMRSLGVVSYGIFLWNEPIASWVSALPVGAGPWGPFVVFLVTALAAIGLGTLSYWLIERPSMALVTHRRAVRRRSSALSPAPRHHHRQ